MGGGKGGSGSDRGAEKDGSEAGPGRNGSVSSFCRSLSTDERSSRGYFALPPTMALGGSTYLLSRPGPSGRTAGGLRCAKAKVLS